VDQDDYVPEIFLTDADYGPVDELLATNGLRGDQPLVAIAPFAAEARKEWPEDRFAQVADMAASALDGQIVIPGSAGERSRAERFSKRLDAGATVLSGETNMRQVAALMERCDLFIGGESGLTHIAYAVGTPLVCIVGPTPVRNGPKGERARTVYAEGIECRPCRRKRCAHRRCLMEVTPEMVMAAVDDLAAEVGLSGPRRARV
jgi:ADP-heptose:LPS heptosyltransferase